MTSKRAVCCCYNHKKMTLNFYNLSKSKSHSCLCVARQIKFYANMTVSRNITLINIFARLAFVNWRKCLLKSTWHLSIFRILTHRPIGLNGMPNNIEKVLICASGYNIGWLVQNLLSVVMVIGTVRDGFDDKCFVTLLHWLNLLRRFLFPYCRLLSMSILS